MAMQDPQKYDNAFMQMCNICEKVVHTKCEIVKRCLKNSCFRNIFHTFFVFFSHLAGVHIACSGTISRRGGTQICQKVILCVFEKPRKMECFFKIANHDNTAVTRAKFDVQLAATFGQTHFFSSKKHEKTLFFCMCFF